MKTKGLTRRLVTRTAIPTIAVFLIALLILSLVLSSQVKTNMNEKLLLQAKTITQESAAFFDEHANLTEQYASDPIFIKYMTDIKNNPQWLDEHPMWPTIHDQLYNAYLLHEDTLVEFYIASYYVMDLASSTGDVMNKDYPGDVDVFHREWMVRPKDEGVTILTAPYVDGQTGNVVCTIASPVYSIAGNFLGSAAIDFLLNDVRDVFANAQVGENGYAMAFLGDGTMFYHPNEDYLITTEDGDYYNIQDFDFPQELVDAVLAGEAGTIINFTDDNGTKMVGVTELLGDTGWITVACMPVSEAYAMTTSTIAILAAIQLLALIVIILSIWLVAKKALLPVSQIAEQADNMANGRTIGELPVVHSIEDEVDVLVTSFAALVDNNNKQTEILHEIAKGNTEIDVEVRGEEDALNIAMKQVVDTLNTLIEETNDMTQYAILGETSYRGDETKFVGGYQRIITGFNATLDAIMREVHILSDAVATLGRGETPDIVNDSQGDYTAIVDSLIACVNSVKNLVDDANSIAEAAKREDYSVRAELDKYQGEYRRAIEGINGTLELMADKKIWYETILDCLGTPLQVMDNDCNWTFVNYPLANHFIDRGLYEKPSAMEGHKAVFNGQDFSGVPELHAGKDSIFYELDGAIYNRTTSELVDEYGLKRGYLGLFHDVTGIMRENEYTEKAIERLQTNLNSLANGSFEYEENTLTADEYQKAAEERFKQIDVAVDAVANAVMALVREAREMSDAAVAGDLEKRIDETKHQGEYSLVAKGFNDTVEAILTPIKEVMTVLERVAGGDLQKMVEGNYQGGHNATKDALNTTIMRLRSVIDDISNVLTSIAGGDLTVNIDAQKYVGDFTAIHESMEIILDKFRNVMSNLCESSDQVANGSRQLAKASSALANGTTQQASAIQQLTATVNEIAIKTKNNAADAKEASTLANGVKASAERGDKQMKGMLVSMQEINESSANISKIIKVIDDIAFQTNILALNAAVEAARAGVHGKGFAVVADEVRNLAAKSAAAANETTALIEGSISKVETGTKIANETAEALGEIVEGIGKAAALVDRISDASSDQATGISEVNIGIEKVSQVVTANSATSEESAASSEELYGQADMLKRLVAEFKLGGQKGSAVNNNRALPSRTTSNDMPEITLDLDFEGSDKY